MIETGTQRVPLSAAEGPPLIASPALTVATADMLSDIAQCEELFHTASGTAFADIIIAGHRWPIRSKRFRAFLRRRYYQVTGETASTAEIRSAIAPILIGKIEIKCPCDSSAEGAAARARRLAN